VFLTGTAAFLLSSEFVERQSAVPVREVEMSSLTTLRVSNNYGECAAFVISSSSVLHVAICIAGDVKEPIHLSQSVEHGLVLYRLYIEPHHLSP